MGNSSSKAARVFPKRTPAPWAGARTPLPLPSQTGEGANASPPLQGAAVASSPQEGVSRASESRTADIEEDAGDPDFLAALNKLGPVRVEHDFGTQIAKSVNVQDRQMDKMQRLFQSRAASEDEASSLKPFHNHLYASSLHELLDLRKSATSYSDLEQLAKKYNIDVEKLESLARFVNSPSVDGNLSVKKVDKEGNAVTTLTAVWANPRISPSSSSTTS